MDLKYSPDDLRITKEQRIVAAHFVYDPRLAIYKTTGATLPMAKFAGALAKWTLIPSGESKDNQSVVADKWLERIAFAARAHYGAKGKVTDADAVKNIASKPCLRKLKRDYRLKPMTNPTMFSYWEANLVSYGLPICPPMGVVNTSYIQDVYESLTPPSMEKRVHYAASHMHGF